MRIAPNIYLKTWNNAVSDFGSNTLIEKSDPLYGRLLTSSVGDNIEFSGTFFSSGKDGVEETSLTIAGSLEEPEFLFKFKSLE